MPWYFRLSDRLLMGVKNRKSDRRAALIQAWLLAVLPKERYGSRASLEAGRSGHPAVSQADPVPGC